MFSASPDESDHKRKEEQPERPHEMGMGLVGQIHINGQVPEPGKDRGHKEQDRQIEHFKLQQSVCVPFSTEKISIR
jgi:hypothetical protein